MRSVRRQGATPTLLSGRGHCTVRGRGASLPVHGPRRDPARPPGLLLRTGRAGSRSPGPDARGLPSGRGRGRDHVGAARGQGDGGRAAPGPDSTSTRPARRLHRRRAHLPDRRLGSRRRRHTGGEDVGRGHPDLLFERFPGGSSRIARGTTTASSPTCFGGGSTWRRRTPCWPSAPRRPSLPRQRRDHPDDQGPRRGRPAYHLVPGGASKANAVGFHMRARGYAPEECIAAGNSLRTSTRRSWWAGSSSSQRARSGPGASRSDRWAPERHCDRGRTATASTRRSSRRSPSAARPAPRSPRPRSPRGARRTRRLPRESPG